MGPPTQVAHPTITSAKSPTGIRLAQSMHVMAIKVVQGGIFRSKELLAPSMTLRGCRWALAA